MKNVVALLVFILCFTGLTKADDAKYTEAMKNNMNQMDSAKTASDFTDIANAFQRIGMAEKDKWLPYYYASYCYTVASFIETVGTKKDEILDQAEHFSVLADSLKPDESEIYVLRGMILQARLQVDPMNRYMKYGEPMNQLFKKAGELNPKNPRPEYLMGITLFYTPEQFGGGAKVAKPILENSLKKYNEFVPANELMPIWGKRQVEEILQRINQ